MKAGESFNTSLITLADTAENLLKNEDMKKAYLGL
jgi:hypothetical protein